MVKCSACGREILPEARFCSWCGRRQWIDCPTCNREVRADARYCDGCGHPVGMPQAATRLSTPVAAHAVGTSLVEKAAEHWQNAELDAALGLFEQALSLYRTAGSPRAEAITLANLGTIHAVQGRLADAERCFREAQRKHQEVGNIPASALATANLAAILGLTRRYAEGIECCRAAADAVGLSGNAIARGTVAHVLAGLLRDTGELEDARARFEEALALQQSADNGRSVAQVLVSWAALERLGFDDAVEAENLAMEAEETLRDIGDDIYLTLCLCERGHVALALGLEARELLEEAYELAEPFAAGPDSEMGRALARLEGALGALESGGDLVRGDCPDWLPAGLRSRLAGQCGASQEGAAVHGKTMTGRSEAGG
ncbi:MAG: tetratricopeptide repeat protein [Candidatus Schekmanbacteria bacterium]|nr:tetratricopeptide repeat protein [Candidatus Schekmanbacteria bacterium]